MFQKLYYWNENSLEYNIKIEKIQWFDNDLNYKFGSLHLFKFLPHYFHSDFNLKFEKSLN